MTYKPSADPNVIDSTEVMKILGISRTRVYGLLAKGRLPKPIKEDIGSNYTHRLWSRDEIMRYKERRIPMTPEEFARRMQEIEETYIPSGTGHEPADILLCEVLRSLGYGEGVDIYEEDIIKWYE